MDVKVLLSSGDEDTWNDVLDATDDRGSLVILDSPPEEVVYNGMLVKWVDLPVTVEPEMITGVKMVRITRDMGERGQWSSVFLVRAVYAPGMWMKAEFES